MGRVGVSAAIIAVLVIAVGFVVAGTTLDVSPFGVAAIIAAVAFGAGMIGLMALLLSLVTTVRELTRSVEELTNETVPVIGSVNETLSGVNTELARVDAIMANVQSISETADNLADVVRTAVANPLIKVVAFGAGTSAAVRSARRDRS